jgi:hypothetical protein
MARVDEFFGRGRGRWNVRHRTFAELQKAEKVRSEEEK